MKISILPERNNNLITVAITATLPTEQEILQEKKFGPIKVPFGGVFNGPPAYQLPDKVLHMRTDGNFKYIESFPASEDPHAERKAISYMNEMGNRIATYVTQWRSQVDILTGTEFTV